MAKKNLLNKTRCYLVGHMQYEDGRKWREYAESELKKLNIIAYNPYKKPFVKDVKEDEKARLATEKQMLDGKYDLVARRMRKIRSYDLNLVDRSDFIIAHLYPEIASWGSAEEIVTACRMKKPVFVSIDGGKKRTPQWLLGMFPHKYIYSNPKQIISMIKKLDDGSRKMDSDRWRLLIEELR
jgi:nucleoside 2-deoxyribosyltransferase